MIMIRAAVIGKTKDNCTNNLLIITAKTDTETGVNCVLIIKQLQQIIIIWEKFTTYKSTSMLYV